MSALDRDLKSPPSPLTGRGEGLDRGHTVKHETGSSRARIQFCPLGPGILAACVCPSERISGRDSGFGDEVSKLNDDSKALIEGLLCARH